MSALSRPEFHSEEAAFAHLERIIWGDAPVCPHCGGMDRITKVKANPAKRIRYGLHRCGICKLQFTVKIGTVFEHMRLPLHKALQAVYLITSSKKGFSAHQLHRTLEITYKSAWFLFHRIREAMRDGELAPMGGAGGVVEVDETYYGNKSGARTNKRGPHHKIAVMGLIDRTTGKARTMVIDGKLNTQTLIPMVMANVQRETRVMTDDFRAYRLLASEVVEHGYTSHSAGVYVDRDDSTIHTNTIEGYFSIFKRGMRGVYQHCAEHHLHRYLAEFDFRYSHRAALGCNDQDRSVAAMKGIVGKRLTYKLPD